jgi:hypothetical protein
MRRAVGVAPSNTTVVFVAGVQRSGTNMVMDILERSLETQVFHERDPRAFVRYELRDDARLRQLGRRSPAPTVVFKALCESQSVGRLLNDFAPARGIWVYRRYEAVVRSHVRKWNGMPETMCILAEDDTATDGWRGRGMSEDTRRFVRSCYHPALSNESACALFWYMRNVLFFEQRLDGDERMRLVSYDRLLEHPAMAARDLFAFLGLKFRPNVCSFVSAKASPSTQGEAPNIDAPIRAACEDLLARLNATAANGPERQIS